MFPIFTNNPKRVLQNHNQSFAEIGKMPPERRPRKTRQKQVVISQNSLRELQEKYVRKGGRKANLDVCFQPGRVRCTKGLPMELLTDFDKHF